MAIEYRWAESQVRSAAGTGGRSGPSAGRRDHRRRRSRRGTRGQGGDHDDSHRLQRSAADPVRLGLVASLSRPGGNLTGVDHSEPELAAKRLELLRELVPAATAIAVLVNPTNAPMLRRTSRDLRGGRPRRSGCKLQSCNASTERDIDAAFATLVSAERRRSSSAPKRSSHRRREQLAALAARHAVPAIYRRRVKLPRLAA